MPVPSRPHLLGIDDGPVAKHAPGATTPLVAVTMEGADLVESVAIGAFPVDGDGITDYVVDWIGGLRVRPALQGLLFGGITIAGLAVLDVHSLAARLGVPVIVVNRRPPRDGPLRAALETAGFVDRIRLLERTPAAFPLGDRLHAAVAGATPGEAAALVRAAQRKSELPEPLRLAHLVARAIVTGESRGKP